MAHVPHGDKSGTGEMYPRVIQYGHVLQRRSIQSVNTYLATLIMGATIHILCEGLVGLMAVVTARKEVFWGKEML